MKRILLVVAAFLFLSCSTTQQAYAGKQRSVGRTTPAPAIVQWQHDWSKGAVFYEIFVRSFSDSNGDGMGDLQGLIDKLDYLNDGNPATTTDLGIDGLWLMPVFESPSIHGYDTVDYEKIEQDYGTNADFQRLLEEAHRRGIHVIVDFVVNHTSDQHPWFIESASSPDSPKRNWYVWSSTGYGWTQPWGGTGPTWHAKNGAYYYGVFWSGMPDVNWTNAEAKSEMFRIARYWLAQGVDGYRLDATRYLVETGAGPGQADTPETHSVLKELSDVVRRAKPDATIVAENWTTTPIIATYYGSAGTIAGGDEMPMNFDFPLADAILNGVNSGNASSITGVLQEVLSLYPQGAIDAPFLTNHDQRRVATVLGNNANKLRNAAAILLTMPGAPFLYYGEEYGMQNGGQSGDLAYRTPMAWNGSGGFSTATPWASYSPGRDSANVASQLASSSSLLARYRDLIRVRHSSAALMKGSMELLNAGSQVVAFVRRNGDDAVLVVHNVSDGLATPTLNANGIIGETLFSDGVTAPTGGSGAWHVTLPPRATAIWKLQ